MTIRIWERLGNWQSDGRVETPIKLTIRAIATIVDLYQGSLQILYKTKNKKVDFNIHNKISTRKLKIWLDILNLHESLTLVPDCFQNESELARFILQSWKSKAMVMQWKCLTSDKWDQQCLTVWPNARQMSIILIIVCRTQSLLLCVQSPKQRTVVSPLSARPLLYPSALVSIGYGLTRNSLETEWVRSWPTINLGSLLLTSDTCFFVSPFGLMFCPKIHYSIKDSEVLWRSSAEQSIQSIVRQFFNQIIKGKQKTLSFVSQKGQSSLRSKLSEKRTQSFHRNINNRCERKAKVN